MFKIVLVTLLFISSLSAQSIESKISKMIVIGFDGYDLNASNKLFQYPLGGVILFDKNIKNPQQLQTLTSKLKKYSKNRLLISVDEEGGLVSRLGKVEGFIKTPSAFKISKMGKKNAQKYYENMAKMLRDSGINCNLAPSVDLASNPQNSVIYKNKRAFSNVPQVVSDYAKIFIDEMHKQSILGVIKHFPGHGSAWGLPRHASCS